jgi:hypothetical protein
MYEVHHCCIGVDEVAAAVVVVAAAAGIGLVVASD